MATAEAVPPATQRRDAAMQAWERAEIERSSVEATLTPDNELRVGAATLRRYEAPPCDTAYPLEYAYALLGTVTGHRIVDFGCGSGANTVLLAGRGAHVWGIDISEDLLRLAQRRLRVSGRDNGATFIAGSAHDMPFPDASIDVVFGMAILHLQIREHRVTIGRCSVECDGLFRMRARKIVVPRTESQESQ